MKATDCARILRPPGTLNWKHDPPVLVTATSPVGSPVSVADLVKNLPDPPRFHPRPARRPRADVAASDPLLGVSADTYYTVLTGRPVTYGNVQCPFPAHNNGEERTPSMRLYEDTFHCFGCGIGGSVFEFGANLWGIGRRGPDFINLRDRLQRELGV